MMFAALFFSDAITTTSSWRFSLARGGEFNARNGNRLMRWRVTMQAVAIGVLVLGFMYKASHPG